MPQDNPVLINTQILQQFINQVKAADLGGQREIKMDITTAKNLSYTLSLAMTRLSGNYEGLILKNQQDTTVVNVSMDGGSWDKTS